MNPPGSSNLDGAAKPAQARVLIAKVGLDGHERGAKIVVHYLREAGFDVTYSGIRNSPAEIVDQVLEHGVQVLGLSSMSGAHMPLVEEIQRLLQERRDAGAPAVAVVVGGVIPSVDREALRAMGVCDVVGVGAAPQDIVGAISGAAVWARGTAQA